MASSLMLYNFCSVSPKCYMNQTPSLTRLQFFCSTSFLKLKSQPFSSNIKTRKLEFHSPRSLPVVSASQTNFLKVIQTVWKVGKNGIEAGTDLVPDSVPRPIARVSVTVVALMVSLFVLKSFLSTALFALATMGLVYFLFIAFNKDNGPKGGGGSSPPPTEDDAVEEARRIMEKYK